MEFDEHYGLELEIGSPSFSRVKRRRTTLGEPMRIVSNTPSKKLAQQHQLLPSSIEKENIEDINSLNRLEDAGYCRDTRRFTSLGKPQRLSNDKPTDTVSATSILISSGGKASTKITLEKDTNVTVSSNENDNVGDRNWKVDDFTLGKPLGKGKFGNVYFAKQKSTSYPVALKVLFKAQINCSQAIKMLKREVEIHYRLQHENIISLHG